MGTPEATRIEQPPESELFCPQCGYDLRALSGDVCPECGLRIDRATLSASRIPWANRRRIGNVRAYLRTLWQMTARSGMLADEMARPADYREAQRFRIVTVALTWLLPAATVLTVRLVAGALIPPANLAGAVPSILFGPDGSGPPAPLYYDLILPWLAGAFLPPVLPLSLLLFFLMVSGVHSYWFHPRSINVARQNRAVALSYYAIAPLAWLAIGIVLSVALVVLEALVELELDRSLTKGEFQVFALLVVLSVIVLWVVPVLIWFSLLRVLRRATNYDWSHTIFAAVGIPLAWTACAAVALYAVPWVIGYVYLVYDSFR